MTFQEDLERTQLKVKSLGRLIQRFQIEDIQGEHLIENSVPYNSMMKNLKKIEDMKQTIEEILENMHETHPEALDDPYNEDNDNNNEKLETMLDEVAATYSSFMKAYSSHCTKVRNTSHTDNLNEGVKKNKTNDDFAKDNDVIKKSDDKRESKTSPGPHSSAKPSQLPTSQSSRPKATEKPQVPTKLSHKIEEYRETGPFLTHLPEFVHAIKYIICQYQKKLPIFG